MLEVLASALDHVERITACTDLDQFETWGDHALTADTIEDLFD